MGAIWIWLGLSLNVDEIEWAEFKMYQRLLYAEIEHVHMLIWTLNQNEQSLGKNWRVAFIGRPYKSQYITQAGATHYT